MFNVDVGCLVASIDNFVGVAVGIVVAVVAVEDAISSGGGRGGVGCSILLSQVLIS